MRNFRFRLIASCPPPSPRSPIEWTRMESILKSVLSSGSGDGSSEHRTPSKPKRNVQNGWRPRDRPSISSNTDDSVGGSFGGSSSSRSTSSESFLGWWRAEPEFLRSENPQRTHSPYAFPAISSSIGSVWKKKNGKNIHGQVRFASVSHGLHECDWPRRELNGFRRRCAALKDFAGCRPGRFGRTFRVRFIDEICDRHVLGSLGVVPSASTNNGLAKFLERLLFLHGQHTHTIFWAETSRLPLLRSAVLNLVGRSEPLKFHTCIHRTLLSWKNKPPNPWTWRVKTTGRPWSQWNPSRIWLISIDMLRPTTVSKSKRSSPAVRGASSATCSPANDSTQRDYGRLWTWTEGDPSAAANFWTLIDLLSPVEVTETALHLEGTHEKTDRWTVKANGFVEKLLRLNLGLWGQPSREESSDGERTKETKQKKAGQKRSNCGHDVETMQSEPACRPDIQGWSPMSLGARDRISRRRFRHWSSNGSKGDIESATAIDGECFVNRRWWGKRSA